jgi:predicted transcriptional regulator
MAGRAARGELEARIMDVLWAADRPMTPAEVQDAVCTPRRRLAYNTVTTVLVRLWDKGMLERKPSGRGYDYEPSTARDEWAARRMRELLDASGDRQAALQCFVDAMSARDARDLRKVLDTRKPRR